MAGINFSHQKLRISFVAVVILFFAVASFSYTTAFKGFVFPPSSGENASLQPAKPSFVQNALASIFSLPGAENDDEFAPAAIFTVNSNSDSEDQTVGNGICADANGSCTLRAAIQEANASSGIDEIRFDFINPASSIQLNSNLSSGTLTITEAVTITGPGARLLTINGNSGVAADVFNITSAATGITKISGLTVSSAGRFAISNAGRLELTNTAITANRTGINNTNRLLMSRVLVNNNTNGGVVLTGTSNNVNISNTTVTGNATVGGTNGAGINSASGDVTLNNVTITNNTATNNGGGLYYSGQAAGIYIRNSIIANNSAQNGPDVFSASGVNFVSRGNNLIGKNAGLTGFNNNQNGDKVGTLLTPIDPQLGVLQNNGGQTDTQALKANSPAKDAANSCVLGATCAQNPPAIALTIDQRGADFPRTYENGVDMGAFETYYPTPIISSFTPNDWGAGRGSFELTINGDNFVADSIVKWNAQDRPTTFVSNKQLKAQIFSGDVTTAGQKPVTVVNPTPNPGTPEAVNFTVANCTYSLVPDSRTVSQNAAGDYSFNLNTQGGCPWTAQSNATWLTLGPGSSNGSGSKLITFAVTGNSGAQRTGTISIGDKTFTVTQSSGCTFSVPTAPKQLTSAAQTSDFPLTVSGSGCPWTATTSTPWISIAQGSQSGNASALISFSVQANTGPERQGTITVNDKTYTIIQGIGCDFALTPQSQNFSAAGGQGNFTVNTSAGCAWSAAASNPWIKITSNSTGSGQGTVTFTVDPNQGIARSGNISVNGRLFSIIQDTNCQLTIAPTILNNATATGADYDINVTANNTGCPWTASVVGNNPWLTIVSGSNGTAPGVVKIRVAANAGPARSATVTIGDKTLTVNQASGCTYNITPPTNLSNFPASGDSGKFTLTTGAGCQWNAASDVPWITFPGGAGGTSTGAPVTINFSVAANNGPARTAIITINNQTFNLNQVNGCQLSLSNPPPTPYPSAGGPLSFNLTASSPGCNWSVSSSASWITINSNSVSGNNSAPINFTLSSNPGLQRSGTITVAAPNGNLTFQVVQANGCNLTLSPSPTAPLSSTGGNFGFTVTASDPGCPWNATTSDSWITIDSATQSGTKPINFTIAANTGPQRTGTISVGGRNYVFEQQSGCVYNLSSLGTPISKDGGSGTFSVTTNDPRCTWTATPSDPWITINSTNNGVVTFTVSPNVSPQRTGRITVANKIFTITQSDGCTFTLSPTSLNNISAAGDTRSFVVNSGAGCTWTATTEENWIRITGGASGTGSDTVTFVIEPNTGPLRSATITAGNKQFNVTQLNGCKFTISPIALNNVLAAGETREVNVTATNNGCSWTASNNDVPWITVNSGGTGSGKAIVTINPNLGLQRNATITVANQSVTVAQLNGCKYTLNPTSTSIDEVGGSRTVFITTSDVACTWTAQTISPWITFTSGTSGTGNGQIELSIAPNTSGGDEREGIVTIGIPGNATTFKVTQVSLTVRTTADSGPGSLRQAIIYSNASPTDDVIRFQQGLSGTILLTTGEIKIENNGKLEIRGPGADKLTISGNANSRIFYTNQATVTFKGLSLVGGNGMGEGSSPGYKNGGAVYVNVGSVSFIGMNISYNDVSMPADQPGGGGGGAIYFNYGTGPHRIENSAIIGNSATFGAGVVNSGEPDVGLGLNIVNSTIAQNSARGNNSIVEAGGIYSQGNLTLINTTIGLNSAGGTNPKGAGISIYGGNVDLRNSIVAKNIGPEITLVRGSFSSYGNNIIGDEAGDSGNTGMRLRYDTTDILDTDPNLCEPALVGGGTSVAALLPGSIAIDRGNNAWSPGATDQRGSTRVINGKIDIGAFEYNIAMSPSTEALPNGSVGGYYSQQITATRINSGPIPEQFIYGLFERQLPPGLTLTDRGFIGGTPTATGNYKFTIIAVGSDGIAGINKYSITVGCSPSITGTGATVPAAGANALEIAVTAPSGCGWNATKDDATWITLNSGSGAGDGKVVYSVAANTGVQRVGKITVAGQVYTITQNAAPCSYSLNRTSEDVPAAGITSSFTVNSASGCGWTATTGASWISLGNANNVSGSGTGTINFTVMPNPSVARVAEISVGGLVFKVNQAAAAASRKAFDFDGDGKADIAVFRSSNASWYIQNSSSGFTGMQFGISTDKIAPADFDGDGKTDISVFRDGYWFRINSSNNDFVAVQWGIAGDVPVPADYDGDGRADIAVFRSGNWYVFQSSNNQFRAEQFGIASDKPVPADFDGDGKTDVAVFRDGIWYWLQSSNNAFQAIQFGIIGDKPVVGNYDSDNKADQAVFRNGFWYLNLSTTGFTAMQFGKTGDTPVPADYDGDGKTDIAVFRDGNWFWNSSTNNEFKQFPFGFATDRPVESAYVP